MSGWLDLSSTIKSKTKDRKKLKKREKYISGRGIRRTAFHRTIYLFCYIQPFFSTSAIFANYIVFNEFCVILLRFFAAAVFFISNSTHDTRILFALTILSHTCTAMRFTNIHIHIKKIHINQPRKNSFVHSMTSFRFLDLFMTKKTWICMSILILSDFFLESVRTPFNFFRIVKKIRIGIIRIVAFYFSLNECRNKKGKKSQMHI